MKNAPIVQWMGSKWCEQNKTVCLLRSVLGWVTRWRFFRWRYFWKSRSSKEREREESLKNCHSGSRMKISHCNCIGWKMPFLLNLSLRRGREHQSPGERQKETERRGTSRKRKQNVDNIGDSLLWLEPPLRFGQQNRFFSAKKQPKHCVLAGRWGRLSCAILLLFEANTITFMNKKENALPTNPAGGFGRAQKGVKIEFNIRRMI